MSHPHDNDPQKREVINRRNFSFRLNLFFFITFLVFTVLIVRLAILQFVEGPKLKEQEANLAYQTTAIPPHRGSIIDASGKPIAYSTSTQSLYFNIEKKYHKNEKNTAEARELAKQLAELFKKFGDPAQKPLTAEEIFKKMDLNGAHSYTYVPRLLKTGLTKKEIAYFLEHKPEYPGVEIVEDSVRNYDENSIAVQLVGYTKKFRGVRTTDKYYESLYKNRAELPEELRYLEHETVGYDGIERMYQEELRGKNGVKKFPVNVAGSIIGEMEMTKPERGHNVHMTMHRDIQLRAEEAMTTHLKKIRNSSNRSERAPYARTGYAVAMEVKTGNVVAMVSSPDYDPKVWRNGQISSDDYEDIKFYMNNGAIRDVPSPYEDSKDRNRHPGSLVPLGSTVKPLSVLIGLQENLFGLNEYYYDRGYASIGRTGYERQIKNSGGKVHGSIEAAEALRVSSNAFMIDMIGQRLLGRQAKDGLEIWDQYMEAFGLGVSTGSGLPGEQKGIKDYMAEAEKNSKQSALAFASFGQGAKYTTLQLAQFTTTLATHGKRLKPQFVSKIVDANGKAVKEFTPEVLDEIKIEERYWNKVEQGMKSVSHGFDGFKYDYLRKTGTSETPVPGGGKVDNAVFIAYAPAKDPVLAVAIVIPEGGFGSFGAAPIARQIFDAYDDVYGLDGVPKKPKTDQSGTTGTTGTGTGASGNGTGTNGNASGNSTGNGTGSTTGGAAGSGANTRGGTGESTGNTTRRGD
ncbi:peptidoglycan D,D-transpeptidase FtsI family protein [Paenibacillus sp. 481]|uniref:peptidoglycan D,D-transpeptidase FtsI family protein n=1 Tax=Paenibacillus sp. 481 TaxID=2835869 RepID=UPI001E296FA2|nr:penicillin-binding protein 2 [Paenibacillus sp. 481]UHA74634.1 penicillin-binding protein 2 [Paenibacillus sp. 481]